MAPPVRARSALWVTAATVALLVPTGPVRSAGASPGPLRVGLTLQSAAVRFGDPVSAVIEVDFDAGAVSAASIHVEPSFLPYVVSAAPAVQRRRGVVRYSYSLSCLTEGCLPTNGPRLLHLRAVTVTALSGSRRVSATAVWPVLSISSRLTSSDLARSIHFRHATTPPPPEYRIAPGKLAGWLIAAAAIGALAAAALAGRQLAGLPRRTRGPRLSPLELAIAYVRDSTQRSASDRRRALELLAESVGEPTLAANVARTAWSPDPPTAAGAEDLADRAETTARSSG
jgi:hypothetical protein